MDIRFGTDGWRAVTGDAFTFANVDRVARAVGACLRGAKQGKRAPLVVVGYDTRFHSERFANTAAAALSDSGCRVVLSDDFLSTPALSSAVVDRSADGGVMISASHNPAEFNGFKFKTRRGASAPESVTRGFERELRKRRALSPSPGGPVSVGDFVSGYFDRLSKAVDLTAIRQKKLKIVADPMHGAGTGYLESLLGPAGCDVLTIHRRPDPLFGGLHPEPIAPYLSELGKAVPAARADAGLATDGDADRIGVVDENGRYLTPHQVFPLLLYYLCRYKGLRGKVVQAISLGYVSRRIADDYSLDWEETPVGFKYIAEHIMREPILIGGEESGGYGYGAYLPERDGILNSLMFAEMLAVTGKRLSELLGEIEHRYGRSRYQRTDFRNPGIPKDEFVASVREAVPKRIAGLRVREVKDYDGVELVLEDDSWLLLRPSGTEPVIRVYCESGSDEKTEEIIRRGRTLVTRIATGRSDR